MICEKCGNWMDEGLAICPSCGEPVIAGNPSWSLWQEPGLGRWAFFNHPNLSPLRSGLARCGKGMCLLAVLNGICFYVLDDNIRMAVISVILWIGLGMGIYLGQSRVCAILLIVLGLYIAIGSFEIGEMNMDLSISYVVPLIGVFGTIDTFKFHKAWKEYKKTGIVPFIGVTKNVG